MKTLIIIGGGAIQDPILKHILIGDPEGTEEPSVPEEIDIRRFFSQHQVRSWTCNPERWAVIVETGETHRLDVEPTVIGYAEYTEPATDEWHCALTIALGELSSSWEAWQRANTVAETDGVARAVRSLNAEKFSKALAEVTAMWREIAEK